MCCVKLKSARAGFCLSCLKRWTSSITDYKGTRVACIRNICCSWIFRQHSSLYSSVATSHVWSTIIALSTHIYKRNYKVYQSCLQQFKQSFSTGCMYSFWTFSSTISTNLIIKDIFSLWLISGAQSNMMEKYLAFLIRVTMLLSTVLPSKLMNSFWMVLPQ